MKKILLATTALLGFVATTAQADEIQVKLRGDIDWGAYAINADDGFMSDRKDSDSDSAISIADGEALDTNGVVFDDVSTDIELIATGTTDYGLEYGVFMDDILESLGDDKDLYIWVKGAFGKFRFGKDIEVDYAKRANDELFLGQAMDIISSTEIGVYRDIDLDDNDSDGYGSFTYEFDYAGFGIGLGYSRAKGSLDLSNPIGDLQGNRNIYQVGLKYNLDLGGYGFDLGAHYTFGDNKKDGNLYDSDTWGLSAFTNYGGWKIGLSYHNSKLKDQATDVEHKFELWSLAAQGKVQNWGVSAGVEYARDFTDDEKSMTYNLGVAYELAPGLTFKGDLNYTRAEFSKDADTEDALRAATYVEFKF